MLTNAEFKALWENDLLEEVEDDIDDSWRHGNNHVTVFKSYRYDEETDEVIETGEYYEAHYRVSGDGEYHGIRENDFEMYQVWPVEKVVTKTITEWKRKNPNGTL